MPEQPLVSVIIVSWNTRELLRECLKSAQQSAVPTEVFVVDNASTDGSAEMACAEFPGVVVIANEANLGFGRANNLALSRARGSYLLLLNPDARLEDQGLGRLIAALERHPHAAVAGPLVLGADGDPQSTRRRFPRVATFFLESTPLQSWLSPSHPLLRDYYVLDRSDDEEQEVDWLVGACLLLRRAALEQSGGFDERFFMYFEETDLCRRLKQAGWSVIFEPGARACHLGARSSDQAPTRRQCEFNESKCRYARKWHGLGVSLALRWFLFGASAVQLIEEALKLALGHKPQLRRERVGMWGHVLRWQAARLLST